MNNDSNSISSLTKKGYKFSGINGTHYILSSSAKNNYKEGIIKFAKLASNKDGVIVTFCGPDKEDLLWQNRPLTLTSSINYTKPQKFKDINEAISLLMSLGFKEKDIIK